MRRPDHQHAYITHEAKIDASADYLGSTRYCDASSPAIRELAHELTRGVHDEREKSAALFLWVRDQVTYRLGLFRHTASETLAAREGSCSNKSNLLIALHRALGIPAGMHLVGVNSAEYIGPLCSWRFGQFMRRQGIHAYTGVLLGGSWLQCDATDDDALCRGAGHVNPPASRVDFNGTGHALLNLSHEHILELDGVCRAEFDALFEKQPRMHLAALRVCNAYIDFMRANGHGHTRTETAEISFFAQLAEREPALYAQFLREEADLHARRAAAAVHEAHT